ncbi:MAG: cysteine desulfurase [Kiritimatiellia bacterium]
MNPTPPSPPFDLAAIRAGFPILGLPHPSGAPLVYLDNAATSQKPAGVIEALRTYYEAQNANVHRGMHHLAEVATLAYEAARDRTARFFNAPAREGVIFTRGTTESINLVAHSWCRAFLQPGDRILLTVMEHHSNIVPWQLAARDRGAKLVYCPMLDDGTLDLEAFARLLDSGGVRLAAFTHVSNALGTVNPVRELVRLARRAGAATLVDAAQSAPHQRVDVREIGCDFLAFSGHKMCGPTGIGGLVARVELLEKMEPFQGGGEMIDRVSPDMSTWADLPYKFEAGTPDMSGAFGLAAAMDYLESVGLDHIHAWVSALSGFAAERLSALPGLHLVSRPPERGGAVSFTMDGVHPHDLAHLLNEQGVAIRAGHLCCQPLMERLGVPAVARASFAFYNTTDEVEQLCQAIGRASRIFGHGT